jgi:hypothetical protein
MVAELFAVELTTTVASPPAPWCPAPPTVSPTVTVEVAGPVVWVTLLSVTAPPLEVAVALPVPLLVAVAGPPLASIAMVAELFAVELTTTVASPPAP